MGRSFGDITLYLPTPHSNTTPEYWEETLLSNFISDLYVRKMRGYKPPKATRITIQPAFYGIWNQTWKNGSIFAIAIKYVYEKYISLDKHGKYHYVLDIIQEATLALSDEHGWDKSVFERAYQE